MIQNAVPAEKVKEEAHVNQRNEEIETKNANWIWYLIILVLISGLAIFLWIYFKRRGAVDQKSEKLPTSKEIKDLLFGLENQTEPSISTFSNGRLFISDLFNDYWDHFFKGF